jgi:hypothetical protein
LTVTFVEVCFSVRESLEFTDADYQFFGDGDIEQGKRNVDAALAKLANAIDQWVVDDLIE